MDLRRFCEEYGYELKDSIDYDWDRYGDGNVSITSLLSLLRDPGFEFVKRNYADALAKACERGTSIHQGAEDFFNGDSATLDKRIMKFHVLHSVEIVNQEKTYVKDGVRGSVDLEAYVRGVLRNVDYKSSAKQSMKYHLQLTGYRWLNGNPGSVLYLSKTGFVYVEADTDALMPAFLELKDYFFSLLKKQNTT